MSGGSPIILLFVIGAVAIALIAFFSFQQQQKRLAELSAVADSLNWRFEPSPDYSADIQFSQFSVFRQGDDPYAFNTFIGAIRVNGDAWPAQMGDYHYQTTSSDGKTTHTDNHEFSYLLVNLPYPSLPNLRIRREGFFDTLAHAFGFSDINFESAEFSKRFDVKSADKKFAYDIIHPAMMEFLMADDPPTIEIDRTRCCLTTGPRTWSAEEFRHYVEWATKFFNLWPKYLVADLKTR
jgi:hypothetical protein